VVSRRKGKHCRGWERAGLSGGVLREAMVLKGTP